MDNNNSSLIFIPDISGFTQFVNETEIQHSQHIIQELLEVLIDANEIKLEVSEIEGDAILFFRFGSPPSLEELAAQCRKMFLKFHEQLRTYERDRVCQCGACSTANRLTLKFVSHFGEMSKVQVKEHSKLIGPSLIVAHRLLKNSLDENEYVIVSDDYLKILESSETDSYPWIDLKGNSQNYEGLGTVDYHFFLLKPLHKEIPDPPPRQVPEKSSDFIRIQFEVNAPMNVFHRAISDLDLKTQIGDVKEVRYDRDKVPRVGTEHKCVLPNGVLDIVTVGSKLDNGYIEYAETVKKVPLLSSSVNNFFYLKEENGKTQVTYEFHYTPSSFIDRLKYNLLKFPIKLNSKKLMNNLKKFAEQV